ncbi:bifunctional 3-(3-hydroxy-phenyl)propionate/3-hydroxycinnamic acid hydroxylase [Trinickia soli]|uniref:2-polyprenyl-6-methoxyphenol hydroxylase n=1 Tax=Trinickia soli TaxID=380675 RepID=A0A2N7W6K8_9BURK|nr:bifunctional 3-(3-hydroxy-phenyl)propionate/3-hydroxycinnamic acid hydroxylase [Trinickia soli]KAA0075690.1 bifunctional 3-(3-hydroxy-phenyl)propionate/3-hydroxycinnamic acid hydroxylase [Paraburkholderia sp. T12-10]PMS25035.1 2-polyprenyl-6-methoxyphenol hydroxylase [Trinickia soli]CAB3647422.1 putative NADH-specific resorcinol 4-hydroxylase [Trinickia soli]
MDFDLIIVGLGPVGAVAANLAGEAGLRTLVLEKSLTVFDKPRAMGFDQEIMRILGDLGLAGKISQYVMPYRPSEYRTTDGRVIRRIEAAEPPFQLGWAPNYVFMQPQIEAALRENLGRFPAVTVKLGAQVDAVASGEEEASVTVVDSSSEPHTYRSRYVLACDGGTSPTRMGLGLDMEDLDFDEPWLVVDVVLKDGCGANLPTTNVQYCEIERPCTFVVGPGQVRRWEFMINADETPAQVMEPAFVRRLISRWLDESEYDIWRASSYRFHALVLSKWRSGRVFFLGDAAHMTPPFLAQGMCQGIRDAANLIWKLALVNRGAAGPLLLDTYQAERLPHVKQTTLVTKGLGKLICERDPAAASERDTRLLEEMAANPRGTVRQSLIPGLSAGFLSASAHGPRGQLFPQPRVKTSDGRECLLDEATGATFRIVVDAQTDASVVASIARECDALRDFAVELVVIGTKPLASSNLPQHYQDVDGVLVDWMRRHDCGAVIARPDHYVYGACRNADDACQMIREFAAALRPGNPHENPTAASCA